jgi:SAM-dependent methyltransferase
MTANLMQARAWNGDDGQHVAAEAARHERGHQRLTARLAEAARLGAEDVVLDVGCGCGHTTVAAARAASHGRAIGIDLSAPMLAEARRAAARDHIGNVSFIQADAQTYAFTPGGFDVAISSFGVMFFDDPAAAFANIAAALRPAGRLAFVCWQHSARCEFLTVPLAAIASHTALPALPDAGQPGPFSLADPGLTGKLLAGAGFRDITVEELREPIRAGSDVEDVIGYYTRMPIARQILGAADSSARSQIMDALREALHDYQQPDGVFLGSAAWLVTARR